MSSIQPDKPPPVPPREAPPIKKKRGIVIGGKIVPLHGKIIALLQMLFGDRIKERVIEKGRVSKDLSERVGSTAERMPPLQPPSRPPPVAPTALPASGSSKIQYGELPERKEDHMKMVGEEMREDIASKIKLHEKLDNESAAKFLADEKNQPGFLLRPSRSDKSCLVLAFSSMTCIPYQLQLSPAEEGKWKFKVPGDQLSNAFEVLREAFWVDTDQDLEEQTFSLDELTDKLKSVKDVWNHNLRPV